MKILIVEDDYLQAESVGEALQAEFSGARIQRIPTESAFYDWLANLQDDLPDVVIIDAMLRWADPAPDLAPAPEEIRRAGPARAGFRCRTRLREDDARLSIPVILYTMLEEEDLTAELGVERGSDFRYVRKDSNFGELISVLRSLWPQ